MSPAETIKDPPRPRPAFAPLRTRAFRLLFAGQTVSVFGDGFHLVALPWLVYQAGGGSRQLGGVLAAYGVCRLATTPAGGMLADRLGAWRIMMISDVGRALLSAALAVVALSGAGGFALIAVLAAGIGLCAGLFMPAAFAIMPSLLPPGQLQAGNALSSTANYAAGLAGPALAGIAVTVLEPGYAFAVDAATFVVSAGCLLAIGVARPDSGAGSRRPAGALAGFWHLLRESRLLQAMLVVTAAANLTLGGMSRVALPALAKENLAAGAVGYGTLFAAFSAGNLVGGLAAAGMTGLRRRGATSMMLGLVMGVAIALVPVAGLAGAIGALAIAGAAGTASTILAVTLVQQTTPAHLLGRVMGAIMFAGLGLFPLSVVLAGMVVDRFGAPAIFWVCGAMLLASFAFGLFQRDIRER
jgi:DHA3 family tetracycline resistance protein-like MFS transporter